jgi:dCTP deaminase
MVNMLLSYNQLKKLVADGVILNVTDELINGTSIDVTLGSKILVEKFGLAVGIVSLKDKQPLNMQEFDMGTDGFYILNPGEFILAGTEQIFHLPLNISAEYKLKSSMARIGLEHLNAGWCDPGWNGSVLTLELINCSRYHSIRITPGERIGQVVFFNNALVPATVSYQKRGRYNGDSQVCRPKPDP